jgi:2-succinyl-5-enolpyruvyl-6-hydroxy-3-cyclohexene-1-carboxylate synthase
MKLLHTNIALHVIEELVAFGVEEFCVAPGSRNAEFVNILEENETLKMYTFYEERSCAFFALGRARKTNKAVAVVTTSGTAAGELLPAVMEAYYLGVPLILVTADRPRRYRGTGAPQAAEQVDLFSSYVTYSQDLEGSEICDIASWCGKAPLHLNICLENPQSKLKHKCSDENSESNHSFDKFLSSVSSPLVIVGALKPDEAQTVIEFLLKLNCPVLLEATSTLKGESRLKNLAIRQTSRLLQAASLHEYPIDAVIRIGGIPLSSLWRNLEDFKSEIKVFSLSCLPFKGLPFGSILHCDISNFLKSFVLQKSFKCPEYWLKADAKWYSELLLLHEEFPLAAPSLIHQLSKSMPKQSHVYLGNSLPIRDWELSAIHEKKDFRITASRGLNGIDGQMSTFFGLSSEKRRNFAILGDLTTLYDMAAPWILPQIPDISATVIVINNGGGKIFRGMFTSATFQNNHKLNFKPLGEMWDMEYEKYEHGISTLDLSRQTARNKLIEIVPDNTATEMFYKRL